MSRPSDPNANKRCCRRIVAATWGIAAAMTRGDISVTGVDPLAQDFWEFELGDGVRPDTTVGALLNRIGIELYGQLQAGDAKESD